MIVWAIWIEGALRGLVGAVACRGGKFWTFMGGAWCALYVVGAYGRVTDPALRAIAVQRGVAVPDAQWFGAMILCTFMYLVGFILSRRRSKEDSQAMLDGSPQ